MGNWYEEHKQTLQGFFLLIPVVLIGLTIWYYQAFPEEYDKALLGGKTQVANGQIIQVEIDTQLIQRRWKDDLAVRYKVYYQFEIKDSTYQGMQILADNWKNRHWIYQQRKKQERIPVEYSVINPRKSRMVIEQLIK